MAVVSTLIGGVFGFVSFLSAILVFETGFLTALGLYAGVGTGTALLLIGGMLGWQTLTRQTLLRRPVRITTRTRTHHG